MGLNTASQSATGPNIVGLRNKSTYDDLSDARAIEVACYAWRSTKFPVPIFYGNKFLGVVSGDPDTYIATFAPMHASTPYVDYDVAVNTLSSTYSKRILFNWTKMFNTIVIDSWYDLWPVGGVPAIGAYGGTARTAKQFTATTKGASWAGGTVTPSIKYLSRFTALTQVGGPKACLLYDRVLTYETCTYSASNQAMTNTLTAQRYISTGDPGLQISIAGDALSNATTANLTQLQYTNNAGTTLQGMPTTPTVSKVISNAAPTSAIGARVVVPANGTTKNDTPFIRLAAGDIGARLIANYTWSAAPTGTFCAALVYPLALIPDLTAVGYSADFEYTSGVQSAARKTQVYDSACLNFMEITRVTGEHVTGGVVEIVCT